MDCLTARARMVPWLDGELSRGEQEQLEAHVAACEGCVTQAERLSAQQEALKAIRPPTAPLRADFWDDMDQRLASELDAMERRPAAVRPTPFWQRELRLKPAAALAYAAVLLLSLLVAYERHSSAVAAQSRSAELLIALEEQQVIQDPVQGSELRTVAYPVHNGRGSF